MLRYILLIILVGATGLDAYKQKYSQNQIYYKAKDATYNEFEEGDYDNSGSLKETEETTSRPSVVQYWTNLFKRARLATLNITNPFSKLFRPYVIKVDFPPGTDPNKNTETQPAKPMKTRKKKKNQNKVPVDTNPNYYDTSTKKSQFFYDHLTQQYYEIIETSSQDYDPKDNFYATTFTEDGEVFIDLADINQNHVNLPHKHDNQRTVKNEDELRSVGNVKKVPTSSRRRESPSYGRLKTKHDYRHNYLTLYKFPEINRLGII